MSLTKVFQMPQRGPYKQYEVDASVAYPRSTLPDRRKRRSVEINNDDHLEDNIQPLIFFT